MKRHFARRVALGFLITVVAAAAGVVLLWMLALSGGPTGVDAAQVEIGLDAITTGNSGTSLGSRDGCRVVSNFAVFDVDLYVADVQDLMSWEMYLTYDPSVLIVTKPGDNTQNNNDRFLFQLAHPPTNLFNVSETLPDTANPGIYRVGAADLAVVEGTGDSGSGVLLRLQFQANAPGGTGFSPLRIDPVDIDGIGQVGPFLKDSYGNLINDGDEDGFFDGPITGAGIVVGAGGTCTDNDGDGYPNGVDNCPAVSNPDQLDTDNDGQGNACDTDDDNDGLLDTSEPAGCQLDADCDNDLVSDGSLDPDGTGPIVAGPDNCIQVPNQNQLNTDGDSMGNACDPDDDNDTVLDGADNCPLVANGPAQAGIPHVGNQTNTDLDGEGDACDLDDDSDGFSDTLEQYIGTDQSDHCANTTTPDDEADDRWGADFDDDQWLGIGDAGSFGRVLEARTVELDQPARGHLLARDLPERVIEAHPEHGMLLELPQIPAGSQTPHDQPDGGPVAKGCSRSPIHAVDAKLGALDPVEELEDAAVPLPNGLLPGRSGPERRTLPGPGYDRPRLLPGQTRPRLGGVEAHEAVQVPLAKQGWQMPMKQGIEGLHLRLASLIPIVRGARRREGEREESRRKHPHGSRVYHG